MPRYAPIYCGPLSDARAFGHPLTRPAQPAAARSAEIAAKALQAVRNPSADRQSAASARSSTEIAQTALDVARLSMAEHTQPATRQRGSEMEDRAATALAAARGNAGRR